MILRYMTGLLKVVYNQAVLSVSEIVTDYAVAVPPGQEPARSENRACMSGIVSTMQSRVLSSGKTLRQP